jgi:hypothetical protein
MDWHCSPTPGVGVEFLVEEAHCLWCWVPAVKWSEGIKGHGEPWGAGHEVEVLMLVDEWTLSA